MIFKSKLFIYLLILMYIVLIILDIFNISKNKNPNIGNDIAFYSHLGTLFIQLVFLILSNIKEPQNTSNVNIFHKLIVNVSIYLTFITATFTSVGDNIIATSINLYIGAIFILALFVVVNNLFSIFIYLSNMLILLYFINISPLLNLTPEVIYNQDVSIVTFTLIAWLFSRYLFYSRVDSYLKRQEREVMISDLQEALENVNTLGGLLPICSSCKQIRDDKGYWNKIETYVSKHSDAEFTHSLCPSCAKKLYPEFEEDSDLKNLIKGP